MTLTQNIVVCDCSDDILGRPGIQNSPIGKSVIVRSCFIFAVFYFSKTSNFLILDEILSFAKPRLDDERLLNRPNATWK